jgi:hypothetical protein
LEIRKRDRLVLSWNFGVWSWKLESKFFAKAAAGQALLSQISFKHQPDKGRNIV